MRKIKNKKMMNDFSLLSADLSYFLTVFEQSSINGAARKLGLDPGNTSRAISKLEKSVGESLFTRHKNGLNATETAHVLYASVTEAQKVFSLKLQSQDSTQRRARIGFHSSVAYTHFSQKMIQTLLDKNLEPVFTIDASVQLVEMLKKRELDFALVNSPVKFPGLISRAIDSEGILLCSKTGVEQKVLLIHPDMLGLERVINSLSYQKRWLVRDYFVIARMLERNSNLMGMIPESLADSHNGLKTIRSFPKEGQITALTWPDSVGVEIIRALR